MKKTLLALSTLLAVTCVLAAPGPDSLTAKLPDAVQGKSLKEVSNGINITDTKPRAVYSTTLAYSEVVVAVNSTFSAAGPNSGIRLSDTVTVICNGKSKDVIPGAMFSCGMSQSSPDLIVQVKPENFVNGGAYVNVSVLEKKP